MRKSLVLPHILTESSNAAAGAQYFQKGKALSLALPSFVYPEP